MPGESLFSSTIITEITMSTKLFVVNGNVSKDSAIEWIFHVAVEMILLLYQSMVSRLALLLTDLKVFSQRSVVVKTTVKFWYRWNQRKKCYYLSYGINEKMLLS